MTTILVLHDDRSVDEFEYPADVRTVTIGRRPSNDVCVPDRSVSGRHARLTVRDDGTWLEDLGSTNGTWLDGDSLTEHRLEDGDEVLVGKVRLKIHTLDAWADDEDVDADDDAHAPRAVAAGKATRTLDDEDSFVEKSLAASPPEEDDDELDESMRRALELYGDDEDENLAAGAAAAPAEDEDEPDFAEDARLFAQSAAAEESERDRGRDQGRDQGRDHGRAPAPPPAAAPASARDADDALSLTDRAKAALGRAPVERPRLHAVGSTPADRPAAAEVREASGRRTPDAAAVDREARGNGLDDPGAPSRRDSGTRRPADAPRASRPVAAGPREASVRDAPARDAASRGAERDARPRPQLPARPRRAEPDEEAPTHELDRPSARSRGAVIQIKNGAKSGQILPIDKPVTTLGRPGIQIAAIMRKPDGYFLMHIESDDAVDRPTLNSDSIGDEPVLLHSGDELNVAGIDVEFMLS